MFDDEEDKNKSSSLEYIDKAILEAAEELEEHLSEIACQLWLQASYPEVDWSNVRLTYVKRKLENYTTISDKNIRKILIELAIKITKAVEDHKELNCL